MSLPPLNLKIGADTRDLEQAIDRVQGEVSGLQRASDGVARGFGRFGDNATALGKRILPLSGAITAAAGGAFMLARGTARAGDEVAKSARAAGTGATDFQELRFAMGQVADMSEGEFSSALTYLNRQMGEALGGNDRAAEALAAIGVSLDDVRSGAIDAGGVMQAFADNASQFETASDAASAAAVLFGRSGADLGPLLRESGDQVAGLRDRAQELGIVLGGDALDASEAFNDKMDELSKQMGAARAQIGQALLPVALSLATAFQDKVVPAIVSVAEGVGKAIDWFGQLPGPVQEVASVIAGALGVGGPVLLAVGAMSKAIGGLLLATGPIGLLIGAAALLTAAWVKWGDDIKRIVGGAAEFFRDRFGGMLDAGRILFDGLSEQAQNFIGIFRSIFSGDIPAILDGLVALIRTPLETIAKLWESDFAEPLRETIGGVSEFIKETWEDVTEWFTTIPERFFEIGANIMSGLREGINAAWESVKESIREKVDWLPNWVKERLGIASPSRVFMEIGENIGQGLAIGVENTFGMVQSAMQNLSNQVTSGAWDMASGVVDAMGQMFQGSKPIAAAQALINTFQGITEALKLPFPANLAAAARVAAQGFAAVRGIQSARPGSSGGGSASRGRGGGGAQQQAAQAIPVQRMIIETQGGGMIGQGQIGQIIDQINEAGRQGYRIDAQFIGSMA